MFKCKHFGIKELVSKKVFSDRGNKAWALLDDRALRTLMIGSGVVAIRLAAYVSQNAR